MFQKYLSVYTHFRFQLYPDCFVFRHHNSQQIVSITAFIHGLSESAGPKFLGAAWQCPQLYIFERNLLIEVYGDRGVKEFEVTVFPCNVKPFIPVLE